MFGAYTFGSPLFAGVLPLSVTPPSPVGNKKGWPFGDDLSIPDAAAIPYFAQVAAIEAEGIEDDDEIMTILHLWLSRN